MGTRAIIWAIRYYERSSKNRIILKKILTDFPTKYSSHFFYPIAQLSQKDRIYLRVNTTTPLLENTQCETDFWKKHCNLQKTHIAYHPFPIDPTFYRLSKISTHSSISIHVSANHEKMHIEKVLTQSAMDYRNPKQNTYVFDPKNCKITTIALGAYPIHTATLAYLSAYHKLFEKQGKENHLLFILCGDTTETKNASLFQQISQVKVGQNPQKAQLTILPLPKQPSDILAQIYSQSTATLTRAGGITAMELMSVMKGEIWIHQEPMNKLTHPYGMVDWEFGNFLYLKKWKKAMLVQPSRFNKECAHYF